MTQKQMIEKMKARCQERLADKMKAKVNAKPQKAEAPKRTLKLGK